MGLNVRLILVSPKTGHKQRVSIVWKSKASTVATYILYEKTKMLLYIQELIPKLGNA
jgi:hypothetical protein